MGLARVVVRAAIAAAGVVAVVVAARRLRRADPSPVPPPREPQTVPLHTLAGSTTASGAAGQHLSARVAGRSYRESTGFWVGCAGVPATLTYLLDGRYGRLTATVGLADTAPEGLTVSVDVRLDDRVVTTLSVDRLRSAPLDVDVIGVTELSFAARRTAGECGESTTPYGVLGNAILR